MALGKEKERIVLVATPEGVALELAKLIAPKEDLRLERDREFWFALYGACYREVMRLVRECSSTETPPDGEPR